MTETSNQLYVAIDGGGTKTVCLVASSSGEVLGYGIGGAANTNFTTVEQAHQSLSDAITGAWQAAGSPSHAPQAAVLTGPVPSALAEEILRQETGAAALQHAQEGLSAWYAALAFTRYECGVTIGAGTGAVAQGFNRKREQATASAWGGLFGDEGGAYWIAIEGMRAVARAEDGRDPPTALRQGLAGMFPFTNLWDFVHMVYQKPLHRREIAAFSPVVSRVAADGDAKAQEILRRAGHELAEAVIAVIRRLGMSDEKFPLVPFGSVFKAGSWLVQPFKDQVSRAAPKARITFPRYEPIVGTLLIAMQRGGTPLSEALLRRLDESLRRTRPELVRS
jgi:N-acetylglucosamine kinase-like BadF-type ATPase